MAWLHLQPVRSATLARRAELQPVIQLPRDATVMPGARVYAGSDFGDGLFVGDGACIAEGCRFGARCVVGRNAVIGQNVTLGDEVRVMDLSFIVGGTVIGARSFIGIGVVTSNDPDPQPYVWDATRICPPRIGADCMIGSGAVISPGVVIGDGARIWAGALVASDVPPGATVRSRPAEIVL